MAQKLNIFVDLTQSYTHICSNVNAEDLRAVAALLFIADPLPGEIYASAREKITAFLLSTIYFR